MRTPIRLFAVLIWLTLIAQPLHPALAQQAEGRMLLDSADAIGFPRVALALSAWDAAEVGPPWLNTSNGGFSSPGARKTWFEGG